MLLSRQSDHVSESGILSWQLLSEHEFKPYDAYIITPLGKVISGKFFCYREPNKQHKYFQ